jgi:hypothetical protein
MMNWLVVALVLLAILLYRPAPRPVAALAMLSAANCVPCPARRPLVSRVAVPRTRATLKWRADMPIRPAGLVRASIPTRRMRWLARLCGLWRLLRECRMC